MIARELEAAGIATLCLTSAHSITAAVNPPRAAFVDFPLGHTAGQPLDDKGNKHLIERALGVFEAATGPGAIVDLGLSWDANNNWKQEFRTASATDDRTGRAGTPQYQHAEDQLQVISPCTSCIWLE